VFKVAFSPKYCHPLAPGHRFPMEKYNRIPEQLVYEGTLKESDFFEPSPSDHETLLSTHTAGWLQKLTDGTLNAKEIRKIGFPYSPGLVERERIIMQGTVDAAFNALENGCGANIAGGTHHAYAGSGEGFCLLNDMAIAANMLLKHKKAEKILIVDLDVHQGNGTSKIFENNPSVFTFSMHGKNNYPLHKEKSTLDVELEDGTDDKTYLGLLERHLKTTLDLFQPDFIFYLCGVDVLQSDKLGRLGLSIDGCRQRDNLVIEEAYKSQTPITIALGGGYSEDLSVICEAHANTFRTLSYYYY
jgi:acetoin utilization deacetylase AcuC-like enzyme